MSTNTLGKRQAAQTYGQQARTILGPLPTTFSPPSYCSNTFLGCQNCLNIWIGQTCASTGISDATACWPSVAAGVAVPTDADFKGWGFYSPGTACPAGYTATCSQTFGQSPTGFVFQFSLTQGETATGCCPSGFQCCDLFSSTTTHLQSVQFCCRSFESLATTVTSCDSGSDIILGYSVPFTFSVTSTQSPGQGTTTSSVVVSTGSVETAIVIGPLIQINHRAVDSATTTSSLKSGPPGSTRVTFTNTPTGGMLGDSSGNGLAGGSIAGIAVGAVVGLTALAAAVALLWLRRRKKTSNVETEPGMEPEQSRKPAHEVGVGHGRPEMHAVSAAEASGGHVPEVQGDNRYGPAELDVGSPTLTH